MRLRLILLGALYAGLILAIPTFWGDMTIYMENWLSYDHRGLETRCGNCHHAWKGVSDRRCAELCHKDSTKEALHYQTGKLKSHCFDCHSEHADGAPIGASLTNQECIFCHKDVLVRKLPTPDDVDRSHVSRSIFKHDSPGHKKYRSCKKCHFRRFPKKRDPWENIFTMETCSERCHYRDDCTGCHKFHDRKSRPNERTDIPERLKVYLELGD